MFQRVIINGEYHGGHGSRPDNGNTVATKKAPHTPFAINLSRHGPRRHKFTGGKETTAYHIEWKNNGPTYHTGDSRAHHTAREGNGSCSRVRCCRRGLHVRGPSTFAHFVGTKVNPSTNGFRHKMGPKSSRQGTHTPIAQGLACSVRKGYLLDLLLGLDHDEGTCHKGQDGTRRHRGNAHVRQRVVLEVVQGM
eukprot:scaffold3784_cov174-Amphora_coffeaeformis.AAC.11